MCINEIPKGYYCYSIDTSREIIDNTFPIKLCPYWTRTKNGAKCLFIKCESSKDEGISLLWDQIKECGINED